MSFGGLTPLLMQFLQRTATAPTPRPDGPHPQPAASTPPTPAVQMTIDGAPPQLRK
jgi:hypothetical protein